MSIKDPIEIDHYRTWRGAKCTGCKKGRFGEGSIHDDWEGKVTCDHCGLRRDSRERIPPPSLDTAPDT